METMTSSNAALATQQFESASISVPIPASIPASIPAASRKRNWWPVIISLMLSTVIIAAFFIIALYGYIAWVLARPEVAPLQANPRSAAGLGYESVAFLNALGDALPIEGWYIPAMEDSKKTIVFSHGYGGNREEIWVPIYELAQNAHQQGYNVLMFDYGYVYNKERVVTGGANESYDLIGAVRYARSRGAEEVVVWGFSMGAGTALQAALRTHEIDAMILDSTFVLEPDTLYHNLKQYADLPKEPSLTLLKWLYPMVNGIGMDSVPYEQVKSTAFSLPIFFIHGTRDERSPYEKIEEIAERQTASPASQLWLVPGATHELVYRAGKEEYLDKTFAFLQTVSP
jgi:uncharacterized protein